MQGECKREFSTLADVFHGAPTPSVCVKPLAPIAGASGGRALREPGKGEWRDIRQNDQVAVPPQPARCALSVRRRGLRLGQDRAETGSEGVEWPLPKMDIAEKTLPIKLPSPSSGWAGSAGLCARRWARKETLTSPEKALEDGVLHGCSARPY